MGLYEYIIKDKTGRTLGRLDGATDRSFSIYLNRSGGAEFTLSVHDQNVTSEMLLLGYAELYIYRAKTLVWGGELQYTRADLGGDDERITVSAKGFLELFDRRVVGTPTTPRTFTNTDLVTIARTLIDESQDLSNGDFGITLGTNPTSRNADRTYSSENLKEALNDLTNETWDDAIDIEVTADKVFNCYYPQKGRVLAEVVFEWGVNITSCWQTLDATDMSNQVIALGAGEGNGMTTVTRNADTYLQETYKLRQGVIAHKSVSDTTTLNGHADKELREKEAQQQFVGVTVKGDLDPVFGSYSVGDYVRVKIDRGLVKADSLFRIHGIDVRITDSTLR